MNQERSIKFGFARITTDEFAITGEQFNSSEGAVINAHMAFGWNKNEHIFAVQLKCTVLQQDRILAVVAVTCHYRFMPEDWAASYVEDSDKLIVPKMPALHFASLTVSTVRGVLHAKTEHHPINALIIPPINVNDFVKGDVELVNLPAAIV